MDNLIYNLLQSVMAFHDSFGLCHGVIRAGKAALCGERSYGGTGETSGTTVDVWRASTPPASSAHVSPLSRE